MICGALFPLLLAHALTSCACAQDPKPDAQPTLVVRQTGTADFVGADDVVIRAACDRLRASGGGTLVLGPGRYVIHHQINLPSKLAVRGEDGAVLALPKPALTAAAASAGSSELVVAGAHEFAVAAGQGRGATREPPTIVQILPPADSEHFADGTTKLDLQQLVRVEGQHLFLHDPLPFDVPAGSRVGYPLKIFWINAEVTLENLAFEGGRDEAIPMPGHSQRCAIWAAAPFGFEEKRLGPPGQGVIVRSCRFSDWYGRAIALYNQVDGVVEGCHIERISDEGIDLDHYVERFQIRDNEVRDAEWGIALNDASRNVVERNRIEGGRIGINCFWYEKTPRQGINEENVIRGNTVLGAREYSIYLGRTCVRFVVEKNQVDGKIEVVEPENTVRDNVQLAPGEKPR